MIDTLEGETENESRDGYKGRGEPDYYQPGFGLDVARVATSVVGADRVVEPVAEDSADEGAD